MGVLGIGRDQTTGAAKIGQRGRIPFGRIPSPGLTGDGLPAFCPGGGDLSRLFDLAIPGFLEGAIRGRLLALSAVLN